MIERVPGRFQRYGISGNAIMAMERPLMSRKMMKAAKVNLRSVLERAEKIIPSELPNDNTVKIQLMCDLWRSLFKDQPNFELGNAVLFSQAMANRVLDPATASMLLLVIANRFRLPLHLVAVADTYHVRWQDDHDSFNFSYGTYADDNSVISQLGIPAQGIQSGAYMRNLTPVELRGAVYFRRGLFYVDNGDIALSMKEFALSAIYWHANPVNFVNMGNSCLVRKNFVSAMENYDTALQYDHDYPEALFYKATACLALKDVEGAKKLYARAVGLKPGLKERLRQVKTLLDDVDA